MKDIGCGGLAFHSPKRLPPDTRITLRLPGLQPPCELPEARVAWCRREGPGFAIGVCFGGVDEAFLVRMVEQVCHIESYRRRMARTGRELTSEQAADEWIACHAAGFPDP